MEELSQYASKITVYCKEMNVVVEQLQRQMKEMRINGELPTAWAAEDHCFFRSGSDASQLQEATWLYYSAYLGGRLSPHTSRAPSLCAGFSEVLGVCVGSGVSGVLSAMYLRGFHGLYA
ncbi:hypothetical protein NC651_005257 [Populus alba x Populus x berolinensis]|nr:hypothetical protein NC651_005257 [Populus alba x Populus x berolinensis]